MFLCVGVALQIVGLWLSVTLNDLETASVASSLPLPATFPLHLGLICSMWPKPRAALATHAEVAALTHFPLWYFSFVPSITSKTGMQQRERRQRGAGGPSRCLSPKKTLFHVTAKRFHVVRRSCSTLTSSRLDSISFFFFDQTRNGKLLPAGSCQHAISLISTGQLQFPHQERIKELILPPTSP